MKTLHIRHIGPITDTGVLHIAPVTVFCGRQGIGKSTIAKLLSTCLWLEKAIVKNELTVKYVTSYNRFKKELCGYHQLSDFFCSESYLKYESDCHVFEYVNGRFNITAKDIEHFLMPKVMYVPAERNFMVAIERAERLKRMPSSLQTLQEEYIRALNGLKVNKPLYVEPVSIQYDKLNKVTWVVGEGFKVKAQQAASGFQSIAPLVLVTEALADQVGDDTTHTMSVEERTELRKEIRKIQNNKRLTAAVKEIMLESLNTRFRLDCFWNIVEEPEQNLYPSSQRSILDMLLKSFNRNEGNGLVMTTHSPYILNYLSINVKAWHVGHAHPERVERIEHVVPQDSWVNPEELSIFQIQSDGTVKRLPQPEGIPSDDNLLNNALAETNELFDQLLEIEDA